MERVIKPKGEARGRKRVAEADAQGVAREVLAEIDMAAIEDAIRERILAVARNMRPDVEQEIVVRPSPVTPFFEVTTRGVRKS